MAFFKEGKSHDIFTGYLGINTPEHIRDWDNRPVTGQCQDSNGSIVPAIKNYHECVQTKDSGGSLCRWLSYPDSRTVNILSQEIDGWMGQVREDTWSAFSMTSMDGLLTPFATDFYGYCRDPITLKKKPEHRTAAPCIAANQEWFGADFKIWVSTFEAPEGVDYGMAGSGVVTSVTLNPFASGHSVAALSSNAKLSDRGTIINKKGYSEASQSLTGIHSGGGAASRPVGLRGPMVLVGWGYDTEGKPVPTAHFDADSRDSDGVPINLPGHCVDSAGNTSTGETNQEDCETAGKRWDGVPTRKAAKDNFYFNHLKRPDKWKAGPIDLRWDRQRKVWTAAGGGGGGGTDMFLCKATRCIMPKAGIDGKNSFNFGILDSVASPGRLYRNPCSSEDCSFGSYFPSSKMYPDIHIYDPEDYEWCGNCEVKIDPDTSAYYVNCQNFTTACVPFYDAVVLRKFAHSVRKTASDCGDKLNKVSRGDPQARRMGDPCHEFGNTITGPPGESHPVGAAGLPDEAISLLYQRVLIENPLNQGLMMGDSFISADTGRKAVITYAKKKAGTGTNMCTGEGATAETVSESLPIHIILQAEFVGQEVITMMGCEQGETTACSKKIFIQGFTTLEDCGPNDDYPTTAITY